MMSKEIPPDLLKKYLRGETSREESAIVDGWYLSLQENPDDISLLDPLELDIVESKILDRIKANIQVPGKSVASHRSTSSFLWTAPFKVAATVSAIAVIGLTAIFFTPKGLLPPSEDKDLAKVGRANKTSNYTTSISQVSLEDGTVIMLKPNSSIEYPEKFSKTDRKIQLTGEAFFDVAKDKNRPFVISAADITIKVLGTSFNVMAYEGAREFSVAVKTGKVSVFAKAKDSADQHEARQEVILTPNQEVIYNTTQDHFAKKLVAEPQIILAKPTLFETQYDGAPVVKILNVLEQNYGIDIQYDEQALSNCILTTSMSEEGLYERIEIICKAIGAQYEIMETSIVINSEGCH